MFGEEEVMNLGDTLCILVTVCESGDVFLSLILRYRRMIAVEFNGEDFGDYAASEVFL
jgi:hypothetical protein